MINLNDAFLGIPYRIYNDTDNKDIVADIQIHTGLSCILSRHYCEWARVEHVFAVIKLKFGFTKVRHRGIEKNAHRMNVTAALTNLFMTKKHLLVLQG